MNRSGPHEITVKGRSTYLFPCVVDLWTTSANFHCIVLFLGFRHGEGCFAKSCVSGRGANSVRQQPEQFSFGSDAVMPLT